MFSRAISKLVGKLRILSRKPDALGGLLRCLKELIEIPYLRKAIYSFLAFLLGFQANLWLLKVFVKPTFYVTAFFFLICMALEVVIDTWKRLKLVDNVWMLEILRILKNSNALQDRHSHGRRSIKNHIKGISYKNYFHKISQLQAISDYMCFELVQLINNMNPDAKAHVTLYWANRSTKNSYYILLAYGTTSKLPPSSSHIKFKFDEAILRGETKSYFHYKLFTEPNRDIYILSNQQKVKEAFVINETSRIREEGICQYIGIPVKDSNGDVVFLFQVDVSTPDMFGTEDAYILEFASNIFLPITQALYNNYCNDLEILQFLKKRKRQ